MPKYVFFFDSFFAAAVVAVRKIPYFKSEIKSKSKYHSESCVCSYLAVHLVFITCSYLAVHLVFTRSVARSGPKRGCSSQIWTFHKDHP